MKKLSAKFKTTQNAASYFQALKDAHFWSAGINRCNVWVNVEDNSDMRLVINIALATGKTEKLAQTA